jgi:uncharacterized protein (DUF433 family)
MRTTLRACFAQAGFSPGRNGVECGQVQRERKAAPLLLVARERTLRAMKPPISNAADILGGTAVFLGTRVPVQTLLDYLEGGETIDAFLDGFPSVSRDQVIAFLEMAKDRLIETSL